MGRYKLLGATATALALGWPAPAGTRTTWFVELESAPAADGTSSATLDAEHRRFAADARKAGVAYRERFEYSTLFNGVAVATGDAAVPDLRALDGVTAVYPVENVTIDQTAPVFEPSLIFALGMTGADIAQSRLGFTGRGVHVAVIDTGIDYNHPDLGGCFGPGCRVTTGYDFVGDNFEPDESNLFWQPDPHP